MIPKIQQVRMFVAVFEERSFTAAAAREGIAQSGISAHIRELEDRIGVQLFFRRTVAPTPAGCEYYKWCIGLLRSHAVADSAIGARSDELTGPVRIGLTPVLTRTVLSRAILEFEALHPRVEVQVTDGHGGAILDAVRRGSLDAGVVHRRHDEMLGLRASPFLRSRAYLMSAPDADRPHGKALDLRDVQNLRLILPAQKSSKRGLLENYLLDLGVRLQQRLDRFESALGAFELVRASGWSMIVPKLALTSEDFQLRRFTLSLVTPELWEEQMIIEPERQPVPAAAAEFLKALRRIANDVNAREFCEAPDAVADISQMGNSAKSTFD